MEISERIDLARAVLGRHAVVKRKNANGKRKTRPVSAFIPRKAKCRRDMSRSEYEQCGKKTRYPAEADARKYAARLSGLRGYPIRAYWCRYCGGYHLTHKTYVKNDNTRGGSV